MDTYKNIYETIFVLHPEMTEEDVEADIQSIVGLLEKEASEIIRIERGGKRRLAYVVHKQRYGYYTLIHFRGLPPALTALERFYRLSERVMRYLTVRIEKEEQLTGFARLGEDDGRDDDRDERRRGGRRGDSSRFRGEDRYARRPTRSTLADDDDADDDDADEVRESVAEEAC